MFLEYEKDPVKQTDDLFNCSSCDYPLGEIADDRRCSECGLLIGAGSRLIFLNRKRSWRGWALVKKIAFILNTFIPIAIGFGMGLIAGFRASRMGVPNAPIGMSVLQLSLLATGLFVAMAVFELVLWWLWLKNPRHTAGLIFNNGGCAIFGKGRAPRWYSNKEICSIQMMCRLTDVWVSRLNVSNQEFVKLPGGWMSFKNMRCSIVQEFAAVYFSGTSNPRIEIGTIRFHQKLRGRSKSIRDRLELQSKNGGFIMGPPTRSHPPIGVLMLICLGFLLWVVSVIPAFSHFPAIEGIISRTSNTHVLSIVTVVAVYYFLKQYVGYWKEFIVLRHDGLVLEKTQSYSKTIAWNEIKKFNYAAPKAAKIIDGCTLNSGEVVRFCPLQDEEARLLKRVFAVKKEQIATIPASTK